MVDEVFILHLHMCTFNLSSRLHHSPGRDPLQPRFTRTIRQSRIITYNNRGSSPLPRLTPSVRGRFVAPFYSPHDGTAADMAARHGGRPHRLPLSATVPALLFFAALAVPLLGTELGRRLYGGTLVYGTLAGYAWLGVKAVC